MFKISTVFGWLRLGWLGLEWAGHFSPDQLVYIPARPPLVSLSLSHSLAPPRVPPYQPPPAIAVIAPSPPISRSGRTPARTIPSELPHLPQPRSAPPIRPPAAAAAKLRTSHRTSRIRRSLRRPLASKLPHPPPSTSPTAPPASATSNSVSQPPSYPRPRSPFRSARLQIRRRRRLSTPPQPHGTERIH